jgi:hypothetical protein
MRDERQMRGNKAVAGIVCILVILALGLNCVQMGNLSKSCANRVQIGSIYLHLHTMRTFKHVKSC